MADVEIVRCRDCIHAEHRDGIESGKRACMVREGLGGFIVPEDGFCFMGEKRRDNCGECVFFRRYEHKNPYGVYLGGVCCAYKMYAGGTDEDREACEKFNRIEDHETREGGRSGNY